MLISCPFTNDRFSAIPPAMPPIAGKHSFCFPVIQDRNQLNPFTMKTKEFYVPAELMPEVAEVIAEHELEHSITGTTEDNEIVVEVSYEKEDRQAIYEIMEILEGDEEDED